MTAMFLSVLYWKNQNRVVFINHMSAALGGYRSYESAGLQFFLVFIGFFVVPHARHNLCVAILWLCSGIVLFGR